MEGEVSPELIATEEGHYKVQVFNTRNKDTKDLMSGISRVTKPAVEAKIVESSLAEREPLILML